jgi:CubicO group peptidase (beta-lactamase class C family)
MAERAAGLRFGEIVQREVLDPLGMRDASMYPPEEWWPRIAQNTGDSTEGRETAAMFNSAEYRRRGAPAGGLFTTVRGIVPFLRAFLQQGMANGRPWLRRETVAMMMRPQVSGIPGRVGALYQWSAVEWGIGWDVKGAKRPHWSGSLTSDQTISHEGFAGTLVWVDPTRELLAVLFTNHTFADHWNLRPSRLGLISDEIVRATGG